jgi:hypothetical protein
MPMNTKYLLGILVFMLCISPVLAQTVTITAPAGQAIKYLTIGSNGGTTATVLFTLNDGSTVPCSYSYSSAYPAVGSITVNGQTASTSYYTMGKFYTRFFQTKEMLNGSTNTMRGAYGQINGAWYNYVEGNTAGSPIISAVITADTEVEYTTDYWSIEAGIENVSGGWVQYILSLVWMFIGFVKELVFWLKFFFVDNLLLVLALYIGITGAVAFNKTKDIFKALKVFFGYQRKLFEFIVLLWNILIQIASNIRGLFKFI